MASKGEALLALGGAVTAIFHIGSRPGEEIRDLIGDAFLG